MKAMVKLSLGIESDSFGLELGVIIVPGIQSGFYINDLLLNRAL